MNQDCLENYFSQFRGLYGYDDNPGAVMAMTRIRNLSFTKNAKFLVRNPSVRMEEKESEEKNQPVQIRVSNPKYVREVQAYEWKTL